jgi:hypothetical protein
MISLYKAEKKKEDRQSEEAFRLVFGLMSYPRQKASQQRGKRPAESAMKILTCEWPFVRAGLAGEGALASESLAESSSYAPRPA